jgi:trimeric autotransporter adhesin
MSKSIITFVGAAVCGLFAVNASFAQSTTFTYQGRLNSGGSAANGIYDFRFRLASDPLANNYVGSAFLTNGLPVTNGLFIATLDFGSGIFAGSNYWLEIDVRTNGGGSYTILNPLQALTPTPYAVFANTASNVSGTISATQLGGTILNGNLPPNPNFSGIVAASSFTGNGANITNVNAASLNGFTASGFWKAAGNSGTSPSNGNFVGTTDNQPLELRVNGVRTLRLEPGGPAARFTNGIPTGAPNMIGGASVNLVAPGIVGAVIGGGGATNYNASLYINSVGGDFGTIGGGGGNSIQADSRYSFIGGGVFNQIQTNALYATIVGGGINLIQAGSYQAFIGGGNNNVIQTNSAGSAIVGGSYNSIQPSTPGSMVLGGYANTNAGVNSFIVGGVNNAIQAGSTESIIGGGHFNLIRSNSVNSTISGGSNNVLQVNCSFSTISGGILNDIQDNAQYCTIGGGGANFIQDNAWFSTIVGGNGNYIQTNASGSTIGGGRNNLIQMDSTGATVAGGFANWIQTNASYSAIGGGDNNRIQKAYDSVVCGGTGNQVLANANYGAIGGGGNNVVGGAGSTIPGGIGNSAIGVNSFAAGTSAQATNDGSFVLTDQQSVKFYSTAVNQFSARFSGGYRFVTGTGTAGAQLLPNATSWSVLSDRNAKKNITPLDYESVLNKLAKVPIEQWNYNWEQDGDVPNFGPMAQDFKAVFYPGRDDKSISTLEFDGVELAAIQGLNQKLIQRDAEIKTLKEQNALLEKRLDGLQRAVQSLMEKK